VTQRQPLRRERDFQIVSSVVDYAPIRARVLAALAEQPLLHEDLVTVARAGATVNSARKVIRWLADDKAIARDSTRTPWHIATPADRAPAPPTKPKAKRRPQRY
jgi:hypothetical protein